MIAESYPTWIDKNQAYLSLLISELKEEIIRKPIGREPSVEKKDKIQTITTDEIDRLASAMNPPPLFETVATSFALSEFERKILLLCVAVEIDEEMRQLISEQQINGRHTPTFGFVMYVLESSHWSSIAPTSPLRYWRLIEVGTSGPLFTNSLRADERILHHVIGITYLDERLRGTFITHSPSQFAGTVTPDQIEFIRKMLLHPTHDMRIPAIQLVGNDRVGKYNLVSALAANETTPFYTIRMEDIPLEATEREALIRLWEREVVLTGAYLMVDCTDSTADEVNKRLIPFMENTRASLFVAIDQPCQTVNRTCMYYEVNKQNSAGQINLWRNVLGETVANSLDLNALAMHFNFNSQKIVSAGMDILQKMDGDKHKEIHGLVWDVCKQHARTALDGLAQRIEPISNWDDLVLAEEQITTLRQIAMHMRQRAKVYTEWGFDKKYSRGLGISVLFSGPSGTGKTMASEVLANELKLDLYRIDLSQVVSKYIGETEKNLARVFTAAEESGAILLFDEADALFGKRSEVKDSHDRYANIEIGYLLQRIEEYRGLAVLTTNLKDSLDTAFLRRIRFVINFAYPDETNRKNIWQKMFPEDTPINGLDYKKLAKLSVTGGNIKNIAMNAAFIAADSDEPVNMQHILSSAKTEYLKIERKLSSVEIKNWHE